MVNNRTICKITLTQVRRGYWTARDGRVVLEKFGSTWTASVDRKRVGTKQTNFLGVVTLNAPAIKEALQ